MKSRPARDAKPPTYPTALEVRSEPELLQKHMPLTLKAGVAAAFAVSLLMADCSPDDAAAKGGKANVAPIFEHGSGRVTMGGVAAPAIFLNEEDALSVMREELSKAGMKSLQSEVEIKGVTFSGKTVSYKKKIVGDGYDSKIEEVPGSAAPMKADFFDPNKKVAVEFISARDYFALGAVQQASTAINYDFPALAKEVGEKLKDADGPVTIGLFYEPAVLRQDVKAAPGAPWDQVSKAAREKGKELVRQQVRDFIDWLKAQGAI